jgi:hypothetical protein
MIVSCNAFTGFFPNALQSPVGVSGGHCNGNGFLQCKAIRLGSSKNRNHSVISLASFPLHPIPLGFTRFLENWARRDSIIETRH